MRYCGIPATPFFECAFRTPFGALKAAFSPRGMSSLVFVSESLSFPSVCTVPLEIRSLVDQLQEELALYFQGSLKTFTIPLTAVGTPFQCAVWDALQKIPFGSTATYGTIASRVECYKGARAVGMANHANPCCIVIPCHRVVPAGYSRASRCGGYRYGSEIKAALLAHEQKFL
ncbi:MAG: methylated-DNA--[protein]-cysteine S-methyltransferase [Chlamydiia bacterium]|nr:methylated-DNA--[protein]-cysteine S-methyltransferase [Chlamydiia bacterium]